MMSFASTVLGLLVAALSWWAGPILMRLWRLPQLLVTMEEKDPNALRIGLLGASFVGKSVVVWAAYKQRNVVVTVVAARDEQRAANYASRNGIPAFLGGEGAYATLLLREDVDAVYIGLPTELHLEWARRALEAGKHVLLEKPFTANASEAEELEQVAKRTGKVLMEAAHYRYHPVALRARAALAEDSLMGPLESIEVRFHMIDPKAWLFSMLRWQPSSSEDREKIRMKSFDRWWYCIDTLLYATGATRAKVVEAEVRPYSLSAKLALSVPDKTHQKRLDDEVIGEGSVVVEAQVEMSRDRFLKPFDWSLHAVGPMGSLKWVNVGWPFVWHSLAIRDGRGTPGARRKIQLYGEGESTYEHQLAAFVEAVRQGHVRSFGPATPLLTMQVADAIMNFTSASWS
eukprot:gnl/TRDRNA2_/TRDRNA2_83955_c0_seq1.p1 gnl/TRDRNA2_/TRDRNA2_83955_c0~~gnl/TRDRNA2_/TRDRNA2_83955_c0_seq1.p1  ORF type:complete len:401 (+),score=62.96 gnl/TRDRNA2_/TRDRNA2_83955_c0_seq1:59-1261(+)